MFTVAIPPQAMIIAAMPELPPPVVPRQIAVIGMPSPIEVTAKLCVGLPVWRGMEGGSCVGEFFSKVFIDTTLVPEPRFMSSIGVPRPSAREHPFPGEK